MKTAGNQVYRGFEGTGSAQILGNAANPLNALINKRANEAKWAAEEAEALRKAEKARDEKWDELMDYAPGKRWQIHDQQILDGARRDILDWQADLYEEGLDPSSSWFKKERRKRTDQYDTLVNKSNAMKAKDDELRKFIDDNKDIINVPYYKNKLNNLWMNPDGSAKDINEISVKAADAIFDDIEGYDYDAIVKRFVDQIPESGVKKTEELYDSLGKSIKTTEITGKFYEQDENGETKIVNGKPVINISDEIIGLAKNDPYLGLIVEQESARQGVSERQIVESLFDPYTKGTIEESIGGTTKYPSNSRSGKTPDYQIAIGASDIDYNDYSIATEEGFAGMNTVSLPTPNIAKSIYLEEDDSGAQRLVDIQGFEQDGQGNQFLKATANEDKSIGIVSEIRYPLTDENIKAIRNTLNSDSARKNFDVAVRKFQKAAKNTTKFYVDNSKISQTVDRLSEVENRENIESILNDLKISDFNIGRSWGMNPLNKGSRNQPYIEIEGTTYYLQEYDDSGAPKYKSDDVEALKDILYNKSPKDFVTDTQEEPKENNTGGAY